MAVVTRYQDRAVELIRAARKHVPAAGRANFEAVLQTDPAISAIRRRLRLTSTSANCPGDSLRVVPVVIGQVSSAPA